MKPAVAVSPFAEPNAPSRKSHRAGPVSELAFPRPDFDAALAVQEVEAAHTRSLPQPRKTLKQILLDWIEGPWAPVGTDLPFKRKPEMSGNSSLPFRTKADSAASRLSRRETLRAVCKSEQRSPCTDWSTMFQYDVPIANLPKAFDGMTILHLSDVHFSRHDGRPELEILALEQWLRANSKRIDLLVISGDVITTAPDDLSSAALAALQRISEAAAESVFVYGNHDFHGHVPAFLSRALEKFHLFDINNQRSRIKIGDSSINIIGVDDSYFGRPRAPESLRADEVNIVVTHNLDAIRSNFPPHVDLILSGHTHWGEIWPLNGPWFMGKWGYCDNLNGHTRHWDMLTDRTLSFVHPGLARYYIKHKFMMQPPGFVIHTLKQSPSRLRVTPDSDAGLITDLSGAVKELAC